MVNDHLGSETPGQNQNPVCLSNSTYSMSHAPTGDKFAEKPPDRPQPRPNTNTAAVRVRVRCVCVLTALCDVADAAVHRHRDVGLRQLLLTQRVFTAVCCYADRRTPAGKVQLPLALDVQSPDKRTGAEQERQVNQ